MDIIYTQEESQIIKIINRQVSSQLVENSYYTSHTTLTAKQFSFRYNSSSIIIGEHIW